MKEQFSVMMINMNMARNHFARERNVNENVSLHEYNIMNGIHLNDHIIKNIHLTKRA